MWVTLRKHYSREERNGVEINEINYRVVNVDSMGYWVKIYSAARTIVGVCAGGCELFQVASPTRFEDSPEMQWRER
jgi:hypothetical protein